MYCVQSQSSIREVKAELLQQDPAEALSHTSATIMDVIGTSSNEFDQPKRHTSPISVGIVTIEFDQLFHIRSRNERQGENSFRYVTTKLVPPSLLNAAQLVFGIGYLIEQEVTTSLVGTGCVSIVSGSSRLSMQKTLMNAIN